MQPIVPRTTPPLTCGVMGIDMRRGIPHRLTPVATHRWTPPPAVGRVGFNVSAPAGAWHHVSSGSLPDETHPRPRRMARLNTGAPPVGGGAILYVATWCQPVGCPRMPTYPHNPACRGGSGHQRLLLSERFYGMAMIYNLKNSARHTPRGEPSARFFIFR